MGLTGLGWLALAVRPALSMHAALPYVAAAYLTFLVLIAIYVAIMARKQRRLRRDLQELAAAPREQASVTPAPAAPRDIELAHRQR